MGIRGLNKHLCFLFNFNIGVGKDSDLLDSLLTPASFLAATPGLRSQVGHKAESLGHMVHSIQATQASVTRDISGK